MTLANALLYARSMLKEYSKYADFILCELLNCDKSYIHLHGNDEFDERAYFKLVSRFKNGEPFEYIFEKADFAGFVFSVKRGVLIPRFDSEILLEICEKELKNGAYKRVLEIGTGSGILSIMLAKRLNIDIYACDISQKAIECALVNAKQMGVEKKVHFFKSDYKKMGGDFDFILSNPPYIAKNYPLDKWVLKEPKRALFGGINGWEMLENIIEFAAQKGVKALACEFGYDQCKILHKILHKNGFKAEFFKDTAGIYRAFLAKKSS